MNEAPPPARPLLRVEVLRRAFLRGLVYGLAFTGLGLLRGAFGGALPSGGWAWLARLSQGLIFAQLATLAALVEIAHAERAPRRRGRALALTWALCSATFLLCFLGASYSRGVLEGHSIAEGLAGMSTGLEQLSESWGRFLLYTAVAGCSPAVLVWLRLRELGLALQVVAMLGLEALISLGMRVLLPAALYGVDILGPGLLIGACIGCSIDGVVLPLSWAAADALDRRFGRREETG